MERPLLREQSPAEYFRELVESALHRQHLQAGDLTEYYLVNLLCQYVRLDAQSPTADHAQPLAIRLARALESGGSEARARLRSLGDFSLFMSGFFADSFARRSVDVDYYKSMGDMPTVPSAGGTTTSRRSSWASPSSPPTSRSRRPSTRTSSRTQPPSSRSS